MSDFDKIANLLYTMQAENLDLAFDLAESQNVSLRPIYDQLADVLSDATFQANIGWMNLPLPILLPQIQRIFSLSIENSTLKALPPAFGLLQGVYLLEVVQTDIAELPETFGRLHRLTSCSFVDCHLTDLPASLAQIPRLQSLSLRQTKIEHLPVVIGRCLQLKTLDISGNPKLKKADFEILNSLSNLQQLILDVHHHANLPQKWHSIAKWL
jgi:Leucine-rich repeat (LRR) protein